MGVAGQKALASVTGWFVDAGNSSQTLGSRHPPLCHVTRSSISSRTVTLRLSCHLFSNWKYNIFTFLPPATKLEQGNMCQEFCFTGEVCLIACWDTLLPRDQATTWDQRQASPSEPDTPQTRGRHPQVQWMLGDTGNKRAVRILLECNLFQNIFFKKSFLTTTSYKWRLPKFLFGISIFFHVMCKTEQ